MLSRSGLFLPSMVLIVLLVSLALAGCLQDSSQDSQPCPGALEGLCGLEGECVSCITDLDCPNGHLLPHHTGLRDSVCRDDQQCPVGMVCVESICVEETCTNDEDCIDGGVCIRGTCRQPQCSSNDDCPASQVCADRLCVNIKYCSVLGECLFLYPCDADSDPVCPYGRTCVEDLCWPGCQSDLDCLDGVGQCIEPGYCSYERCPSSGECPEGFKEVAGTLACRPNK